MNRLVYSFFKTLFLVAGRLLFGLRFHGLENLPSQGAVVLVANHASFMDPPLLGCGLSRPVHYLARSNLRRVPVLGWIMVRLGVLFVARDGGARAGLELGISTLEAGGVIGLFPEGTRSLDGEIGTFKRGMLLILKRLQERGMEVSVVPAGIRGSFRAWPKGHKLPRLSRCEVHFGRVLSSQEVLADRGLQTLRRQVSILAGKDPGPEGGVTPARLAEVGESLPPNQIQTGQNSDHSSTACSLAIPGGASRTVFGRMFPSLGTEVPSSVCLRSSLPGPGHGISSKPA